MKRLLLSLLLITTFSCSKKGTSNVVPNGGGTVGSSGSTGGSGSSGYGDGNEPGVADAGQTDEYRTISNIITHSKLHSSNINRSYIWSSKHNLSSSDQGMFYTNSRFNLRVRAQAAPPKGNDSSGQYCNYQQYEEWYRYTVLDLDVCVRKDNGSCVSTHTFSNVPVGQVSRVKEFSVPATSLPLVVEVVDVRWNTGCLWDRGNSDRACPTFHVWSEHCVKFDIQFSTDYTKDFAPSAPRY